MNSREHQELKLGSQTLPGSFLITTPSRLHSLGIQYSLISSTQVWYLVGLNTGEDQFSKHPRDRLIGSGVYLWMNQEWLRIISGMYKVGRRELGKELGWHTGPRSIFLLRGFVFSEKASASIWSGGLLIGVTRCPSLSGQSFLHLLSWWNY